MAVYGGLENDLEILDLDPKIGAKPTVTVIALCKTVIIRL